MVIVTFLEAREPEDIPKPGDIITLSSWKKGRIISVWWTGCEPFYGYSYEEIIEKFE